MLLHVSIHTSPKDPMPVSRPLFWTDDLFEFALAGRIGTGSQSFDRGNFSKYPCNQKQASKQANQQQPSTMFSSYFTTTSSKKATALLVAVLLALAGAAVRFVARSHPRTAECQSHWVNDRGGWCWCLDRRHPYPASGALLLHHCSTTAAHGYRYSVWPARCRTAHALS